MFLDILFQASIRATHSLFAVFCQLLRELLSELRIRIRTEMDRDRFVRIDTATTTLPCPTRPTNLQHTRDDDKDDDNKYRNGEATERRHAASECGVLVSKSNPNWQPTRIS